MNPKPIEIPPEFDPTLLDRYVLAAGIPTTHAAMSPAALIENPRWARAYAAIAWSIVRGRSIQLVLGSRGTGKTQMAAAMIRAACWRGGKPSPRYTTLRDLWARAKAAMADNAANAVIEQARRASLLVLDEVGQADWTPWEQAEFTALIDWRYANAPGPTVLIANDTREAASERLGKSVMSRVYERGEVHELTGWNFRTG